MKFGSVKRFSFLFILVSIKITAVIVFLYILIEVKERSMIPAMIDQYLYLADIQSIYDSFYFVLETPQFYASNNTLYSRLVGSFGKILQLSAFEPIIAAVLFNTISHTFLSFFTMKYYSFIGGKRPLLLFFLLYMMPSMFAYTLFALRDTMIVLFFTIFIFSIMLKKYVRAIVSMAVLFFMRPLLLAYTAYLMLVERLWRIRAKKRSKIVIIAFYGILLLGVAYVIIDFLQLNWILKVFSREHFTTTRFFMSTVGLGVFAGELTGETALGATGSKMVRYFMFDSLFIPTLSLFSSFYLFKKGDTLNKKVISFLLIFLMFSLSLSYIAIQGNYPFRKLLPLLPLQYVICFLAFEQWSVSRRESKKKKIYIKSNHAKYR